MAATKTQLRKKILARIQYEIDSGCDVPALMTCLDPFVVGRLNGSDCDLSALMECLDAFLWDRTRFHAQTFNKPDLVAQHLDLSKVIDIFIKEYNCASALHYIAEQGNLCCLNHPDIAKAKDDRNFTPLHYLAAFISEGQNTEYTKKAFELLLKHPMVSKVKNVIGETPLHILARSQHFANLVLQHPDVNRIHSNCGDTPKDIYEEYNLDRN